MIRAAALLACLLLAACGQRGNLYIPDDSKAAVPVTPVPAQSPTPAGADDGTTTEEQRQRQQRAAPGNNPPAN